MKYLSLIILLSISIFYACEKEPSELIVGTWVNEEFPEEDTILITLDSFLFVNSRPGDGFYSYSIEGEKLILDHPDEGMYTHPFEFLDNDRLYIGELRGHPSLPDDGFTFKRY